VALARLGGISLCAFRRVRQPVATIPGLRRYSPAAEGDARRATVASNLSKEGATCRFGLSTRLIFNIAVLGALALSAATSYPVAARDDGRYAQSPLKPWFDQLKSRKGYCCSDADGEETEYEMRGQSYWAPIDGVWQPVPTEAVITEPNKVGRAMKWLYMENGERKFRCFLPAGGV
jgi:hypothetical protein